MYDPFKEINLNSHISLFTETHSLLKLISIGIYYDVVNLAEIKDMKHDTPFT